ncbi:sensor histidine kinase [uncultured Psychrobacter sp.]|uniref:sensor histidine kinase n=1 Tax=uncultured Psychrobacter sp. TaxID=259303 RepID=UPI0034594986
MKKPLFEQRLTLFWRLFLSLILTILFTAVSSVLVERWLNERELNARMAAQIERLSNKREQLVVALEKGDLSTVRQLYEQDRRFMTQITIYDEQGAILFPRYGRMQRHRQRSQVLMQPKSILSDVDGNANRNPDIANASVDSDNRPEMADIVVTLPDRQTLTLQTRPQLRFADVVELQRGNFIVRLILIILFSTLVCFWLSRTMIRRISHVQDTVRQMIEGNYQTGTDISNLGSDELGLLAKDVAQLSTRLVDSELARKQMLSDISHELRSPLARLEVATELTRDFAPQAERYLDRIDKESKRMNELTQQIIHIQSLQMQQYTTDDSEKQPVNMAQIISEIEQDVCFEFQNKNVHWQRQAPTDKETWTVLGNQEQLHSALENVIRNAFIHTPANSQVTVSMVKTKTPTGRQALQISILDEGSGVAEADLQRIFQPFVRLDVARQRQTGGYGLGLAIAHAVVLAHQGQIHAYNREDGIQGLVIQIVLPIL